MKHDYTLMSLMGLVAVAIGWASILISITLNPWFSLCKNTLSDLGALGIPSNYVFNVGLMIASIPAFLYGLFFIKYMSRALSKSGGALLCLSAIFLFLTGFFPEGVEPHFAVSTAFFTLTLIAAFIVSLSVLTSSRGHGVVEVALIVIALCTSLLPWPSIGALETAILVLVTLWLIVMLHYHLKVERARLSSSKAIGDWLRSFTAISSPLHRAT